MVTNECVQRCGSIYDNPNTTIILSSSLAEAIRLGQEMDVEREISQDLIEQQESFVVAEMAKLGNPFHNEHHTLEVARRAYDMAMNTGRFSLNELRLLYLAGLYHDFDHAGVTYRQLVKDEKFSNEEVAAIAFDEFLGQHLSIQQRIIGQGLIVSSSFGQLGCVKLPKPELERNYQPWTEMEWILHLADISSVDCSFAKFLEHGQDLIAEMRQHNVACPKCWSEFIRFEDGFVRYFLAELEQARTSIAAFDYACLKRRAQQALMAIADLAEIDIPAITQRLAAE